MSSRRNLLIRRGESQLAGGMETDIYPFNLLLLLSWLCLAETERVLLLVKSDHGCPLGDSDLAKQLPKMGILYICASKCVPFTWTRGSIWYWRT